MTQNHKKTLPKIITAIFVLWWSIVSVGFMAFSSYSIDKNKSKLFSTQSFPVTESTYSQESTKNQTSMVEILTHNAQKRLTTNAVQFIKIKKKNYKKNFNFTDDASLQRYIDKKHPLNNIKYIPIDLEPIDLTYVYNKAYRPRLRAPARKAFQDMSKDFYNKFHRKLYLMSAYRSYADQMQIIKKWCNANQCATPWTSEHQLGLAVDIHISNNGVRHKMNKNSKYYSRLNDNAHLYGFHNTYKNWLHTDEETKIREYRHRRYLTEPVATFLQKKNISIWEYYHSQTANH